MEIQVKEQQDGKTLVELAPTKTGEARPPLSRFLVDAAIDKVSGDRLAAAAALIFQQHFRGSITMPKPVSPQMSAHLTRFRQPVWCSVGPVEDAGSQFGGRGTTVVLDGDHQGWEANNVLASGPIVVLSLLRGDQWSGRLFSMHRFAVGSNAWLFDTGADSVRALTPYVGAALLLGSDLECSRLLVPHERRADPAWEEHVVALVSAVGVDLEFCTPSEVQHLVRAEGAARVR